MKARLPLSTRERKDLFKIAAATPRAIELLLRNLSAQQLLTRPATGFSLHEQVWHLADLEKAGFQRRLQLLLSQDYSLQDCSLQDKPLLENFDGDKVAALRNYHALPLPQAFSSFSETRLQNLWVLSGISHTDWMKRGIQEDIGPTCVADIFRAMVRHDQAHLSEIQRLLQGDNNIGPQSTAAA